MEVCEILRQQSNWCKCKNEGGRLIWSELTDNEKAAFIGANLSEADLCGANLCGADLSGADLSGANLSEANLRGANLSEANLSEADLSGANLSKANLIGANLCGANLIRANLIGANLSGADLSGAVLNWYSHDLVAEILLRAAKDDMEKRKVAGLILISREWCWGKFLSLHDPLQGWALDVLRGYTWEKDNTPSILLTTSRADVGN